MAVVLPSASSPVWSPACTRPPDSSHLLASWLPSLYLTVHPCAFPAHLGQRVFKSFCSAIQPSPVFYLSEYFARQQSMKTLYKAPFFFSLGKSSLFQAWVTCRAVHSARAPLPSSHYLVCKEVTVCAFRPRGRRGTLGIHALSRTCLLIPVGSVNNNTLVSGS